MKNPLSPRSSAVAVATILATSVVLTSCGGSGALSTLLTAGLSSGLTGLTGLIGGSSGGTRTCSYTYATPNYASDTDPSSNLSNLLLAWPGFPLNVYVSNRITKTFTGATYDTDAIVADAFNRWAIASNSGIRYNLVSSASAADITIKFTDLASEPIQGGELGITQISYYQASATLKHADVTVATWTGMTRAQFTQGLHMTVTHELGHALFLSGHSSVANDVMYYASDPNFDKPITTRDTRTLLTAYCGAFGTRSPGKLIPSGPIKTLTIVDRR